jgi:hypothetical protein
VTGERSDERRHRGGGRANKARKVACLSVEYFFYCRGRPGTEALADELADELAEAHWSFMDGYAEAMIASAG